MESFELTYKRFGEHSILIEWPQKIEPIILNEVISAKIKIEKYYVKQKVEINTSYCSILISYNTAIENIYDKVLDIKQLLSSKKHINNTSFKRWKIPVCYDKKFGIDLIEISKKKELQIDEIIELHTSRKYKVYGIGFLPGFLYLGGLSEKLHSPRKETPRLKINRGDVGIGGNQTGIYPSNSPGGWNIIGNSPLSFFDVTKETPCFAFPGDEVKFHAISVKEHSEILELCRNKKYILESEVVDA